jgi:hypothetical protein
MSQPHKLRCYEYVERPYERVRAKFHDGALGTLQRATASAATRANALAATLHAGLAGISVGVDVRIRVKKIRDDEAVAGLWPVTTMELEWEADKTPALFPLMSAELCVSPVAGDETQLLLEGEYRPPLGAVGRAVDAVVGHRIAEAAVHRLLRDLAEELRRELPARA